jgi:hypothetical protein
VGKYVGTITLGSSVNLQVDWILAGAGATNPTASSVTLEHETAKDGSGNPITLGPYAGTQPDAVNFPLRWRRATVTPTQAGRWRVKWTATVASGPTPTTTSDVLVVSATGAPTAPYGKSGTY